MRQTGEPTPCVCAGKERFITAPGKRPLSQAVSLKVLAKTANETPLAVTHWSVRTMADRGDRSYSSRCHGWARSTCEVFDSTSSRESARILVVKAHHCGEIQMAGEAKDIYVIEYEIDLKKIDKNELKTIADEMVKRLMDAAAANRGGSIGHDRHGHDKVHAKWG